MFTNAAASLAPLSKGKFLNHGRWKSRVSGRPISSGMLPSSTMAEEILTPGEGQVRAMITLMTNPVRSTANSEQMEAAFSSLEFFVAVDFYINETTRHAHLILPTPTAAEQACYELGLYHSRFATLPSGRRHRFHHRQEHRESWEVMLKLYSMIYGQSGSADPRNRRCRLRATRDSLIKKTAPGRDLPLKKSRQVGWIMGPGANHRPCFLRIGPHGDGFGRRPEGLTLAKVRESSSTGSISVRSQRGLREIINTPSGKVELAPPAITEDIGRLRTDMSKRDRDIVLIGRRNLRTSNSFMHNLPALVKGRDVARCKCRRVMRANRPYQGTSARITSRVGSVSRAGRSH